MLKKKSCPEESKVFGVVELKTCEWIKIEAVSDIEKVNLLSELEQGEAEVIILAKE